VPQVAADPVLSGARAALAAGRYESPAGRNALDLYAAVLLARPGHPEARAGLDETAARLVALAASEAQAGDTQEARRLVGRVIAADPGHVAARTLQARLDTPTQPAAPPAAQPIAPPPASTAAPRPAPPTRTTQPTATVKAPTTRPPAEPAAPDPLTPRFVAPAGGQSARASAGRGSSRSFGPPISSGHPIAGYAQPAADPGPATAVEGALPIDAAGGLPDRDLEQLVATEPVYPLVALRNRIEGWVEVDFTVTESGVVRDVEIVAAEPRGVFDAAASAAVGQWRFRPRVVNGRPVPQRSSVTLRFNVEG
jgi:protein TonB